MNKGLWLAVMASMLWGIDYAVAEVLFKRFSIYWVMMTQYLLGACLMALFGWKNFYNDINEIGNNNTTWWWLGCMLISNAAMYLIAASIKSSNATIAGLVEISYPIFIILASWMLFGNIHLTPRIIIGGVLILIGVFIIGTK